MRVLEAKGRKAAMCTKMQVVHQKQTPEKQHKEVPKKKCRLSSVGEAKGT